MPCQGLQFTLLAGTTCSTPPWYTVSVPMASELMKSLDVKVLILAFNGGQWALVHHFPDQHDLQPYTQFQTCSSERSACLISGLFRSRINIADAYQDINSPTLSRSPGLICLLKTSSTGLMLMVSSVSRSYQCPLHWSHRSFHLRGPKVPCWLRWESSVSCYLRHWGPDGRTFWPFNQDSLEYLLLIRVILEPLSQ